MSSEPFNAGGNPSSEYEPPGLFDLLWWKLNDYALLLGFLVFAILCGLLLLTQRNQPQPSEQALGGATPTTAYAPVQLYPTGGNALRLVWAAGGESSDLYRLSLAEPTPVNLTNSPDYTEGWAVPAPTDDRIAFFAVSKNGERSLRVLDGDLVLDLTYRHRESGLGESFRIRLQTPPFWSPDGRWIAFLAEQSDGRGKAVELFVARADGTLVQRISANGNVVEAMTWLDAETIVYAERRGDGSYALYRASPETASVPELIALLRK